MLHAKGGYTPEATTGSQATLDSHLKQLSSALKNHLVWWNNYQSEGIHEDLHPRFQYLQATFNIPKHYENPDNWPPRQHRDAGHCLTHRCVSVWWYYGQAMRDIPGFGDNTTARNNSTLKGTTNNQHHNQPRWGIQHNQSPQP